MPVRELKIDVPSPALPPPDCLLSTSATTIGGGSVDGSSVSSRWNTTVSICVREAFAVAWFTSLLEPRWTL